MNQDSTMLEPALVKRAGAAEFLSVSPRMIDILVERGELRMIRVPGVRRVAFAVDELRRVAERWKAGL